MPKPTSITVEYTIGISRSLGAGTFSNAKTEAKESETWDVSDLDEVAIELLASTIRSRLTSKLDAIVEAQDKQWRG